ncbi:hypothetical protein M3J09_008642 [Ascochyta lentis]
MCNYCSTIDEAHYKRHHELVAQLRSIYESCGELDWTIVPAEPGDPRRGRSSNPQSTNSESDNRNLIPDETPVSKRERKDAKCLVRAASRARVVTQEEIKYVDSVLHTPEGIASNDSADPASIEDLQLIEAHLRYNANVYSSHASRYDLRKFATIPDVDVDFDAEIERVLDTFRVTELVKRNLKNRGLQGKELKEFDNSVESFKTAVVEDLVLVKKDVMEVRMRRAGYLRYTNKAAYQIVEDRYTDKDWKTGERITSSSSDSSSLTSLSDEPVASPIENNHSFSTPVIHSTHDVDRRHLEHVHVRVSGNDGLGQSVIEPFHTPLVPMTPNTSLKRPAILQLKVVENKEKRPFTEVKTSAWLRRGMALRTTPSCPTYCYEEDASPQPPPSSRPMGLNKPDLSVKPVQTSDSSSMTKQGPAAKYSKMDKRNLSALKSALNPYNSIPMESDAPAVQAPTDERSPTLKGPDRVLTPDNGTKNSHAIVSQKKEKKIQRETKRKAKKSSGPEESPVLIAPADVDREKVPQAIYEISSSASEAHDTSSAKNEAPTCTRAPQPGAKMTGDRFDRTSPNIVAVSENRDVFEDSVQPISVVIPCTTYGKHDHWTRFARIFIVDQLTVPLLQSFEGCSHGSSCLFESHKVPDCPFHEPHCACPDPLRNQCTLMHPGTDNFSAGPYNRAHGERLMALYEQDERTKGRVMLVDDDLVSYFMDKTSQPTHASMPTRLLKEHTEFQEGYERGPLMKQESDFERMFVKNLAMKRPLTMRMLQDIQYLSTGSDNSDELRYCYCYTETNNPSELTREFNKDIVECSYRDCEFGGVFHKRCVKKLGTEKVSRWYCTACEKRMKAAAHKVLNLACVIEEDAIKARVKKIAEMMDKPGGAMGIFRSHFQELCTREANDDLGVENVD